MPTSHETSNRTCLLVGLLTLIQSGLKQALEEAALSVVSVDDIMIMIIHDHDSVCGSAWYGSDTCMA